jgi:MFS family permease
MSDSRKKSKEVKALSAQMFMSCLGISMMLQARPQMMLRILKGITSQTSKRLATLTAIAAAGKVFFFTHPNLFLFYSQSTHTHTAEFTFNPTFGAASDRKGRKICLAISPILNCILRFAVALSPSEIIVSMEKVITSTALSFASVTTSATIADIAAEDPKAYAMAAAKVGICAGLSFVVGPIVSGILIRRKGPRAVYLLTGLIALAQTIHLHNCFFETLKREDRHKGPVKYVSPFSFTRLLRTTSRPLRLLTTVGLLQTFCEPKTWNDMVQLYMSVDIGLNASSIGRFFALFGMGAILSKGLTRVIVKKQGFNFHTRMANLSTVLAFIAWGINPKSILTSVCIPLGLSPLYMDRRAGVSARANLHALKAGFGKGEHAALFGNLRALAVVFAPLMFGRLYAWGSRKKSRPSGLPFLVAAVFAFLAEIVHRRLVILDRDDDGDVKNGRVAVSKKKEKEFRSVC